MLPDVIVPSFKRRHTGVTSTMWSALKRQVALEQDFTFGLFRVHLGALVPSRTIAPKAPMTRVSWWQLFRYGWQRPAQRPFRIWHARRNNEMFVGLLLRDVLRMKLKLVFTSAAIRSHSFLPRLLIARMDAVIAVTQKAAALVPNVRAIAPHGVDLQTFHPDASKNLEKGSKRQSDRELSIGIFGRVRPEKGTDLFVDALCRVLPDFPHVRAHIVGACLTGDKAFQRDLVNKIQTAGLGEQVLFMGEVPHQQIQTWFRRIDLCVACPRYEGYGMTPLEAMACGCAVLATDTGAFSDFVEEGVSGHIVPIGDVDALSERLTVMLSDPNRLKSFGLEGRKRAEAQFSIEGEAKAINQVYETLWTEGQSL